MVSKILHTFWLQGRDEAPRLVDFCLRQWVRLNPDYELNVWTIKEVERYLTKINLDVARLAPQALSDIVRIALLREHGGVWVDGSLLPVRPLDEWLNGLLEKTGFFAFASPGRDRPLSSWFLAAEPGSYIVDAWGDEVSRFWSRPRIATKYGGKIIPPDPIKTVAPGESDAAGEYPYYWLHYLFAHRAQIDQKFGEEWCRTPKISANLCHSLQFFFEPWKEHRLPYRVASKLRRSIGVDRPVKSCILRASLRAPVQKLDWRFEYPELFYDTFRC